MWLYRGRSSSSKQVLRGEGGGGGGWQDDLLLVNRERERNKKVNNHHLRHHPLTKRGRIFLLKHPFVPGAASQEELAKTEELRSCEIATIGAKPPKRTTKRKSPGKNPDEEKKGKTALPLSQPEEDFPPRHSRAEDGNSLSPLHHFFVCFYSLDFYFILQVFPHFYVPTFMFQSFRVRKKLKIAHSFESFATFLEK